MVPRSGRGLIRWLIPFLALTTAVISSCSHGDEAWVYRQPPQVGDGWVTASLAEAGVAQGPLAELMDTLRTVPGHLVEGIVIAVHGKLVFEEYFDGVNHPTYGEGPISYDRQTKHCLSSVTKSVTATLLGLAIDRGSAASVDEKLFDFFPEMADLNTGLKSGITLRHLVTMSAGLQWDESTYPIGDMRNDITAWFRYDGDLLRFVLERPMVAEPGTLFTYNGGLTNILGEVVRRASGQRLDLFSETAFFAPLGITDFSWYLLRPDFVYASGDLSLRPRDAAKIGQLYLQGGLWNGSRLLSEAWVAASATPAFLMEPWPGFAGYSFGWWLKTEAYGAGAFAAEGWGGQAIIVMPELDAVVVFTGGSYWKSPLLSPHRMMVNYILPAIKNEPS
jgi:CubicO group peptidase (beta-lactamase class C family)